MIISDVFFVCFFVERQNKGKFPIIWYDTLVERGLKKDCKDTCKFVGARFEEFSGYLVGASRFVAVD